MTVSVAVASAAARPIAGLRASTRDLHDALDASFALVDWLRDDQTFGSYLAALAASHRDVESRIDGRSIVDRTGFRPKSHLVDADLDRLGVGRDLPSPAVRDALPTDPNDDQTLGMLYVIEGSQLGGRVIADLAHQRLTGCACDATDFLLAYGAEIVPRWRRTVAAINASVVDVDVAAAAARTTFRHVGERLAQGAP